jgi:hypothetical protein
MRMRHLEVGIDPFSCANKARRQRALRTCPPAQRGKLTRCVFTSAASSLESSVTMVMAVTMNLLTHHQRPESRARRELQRDLSPLSPPSPRYRNTPLGSHHRRRRSRASSPHPRSRTPVPIVVTVVTAVTARGLCRTSAAGVTDLKAASSLPGWYGRCCGPRGGKVSLKDGVAR